MACMTQHEWQDLVALTMPLGEVQAIADFHGEVGPTKPGLHSRDWVCCDQWHPDKKCRGWFDNATGLLVDKNVVDR